VRLASIIIVVALGATACAQKERQSAGQFPRAGDQDNLVNSNAASDASSVARAAGAQAAKDDDLVFTPRHFNYREMSSLPVRTDEVKYLNLPILLRLPGKIQPEPGKEVDVNTRILGRVRKVAVHAGEPVSAGQLLGILDSQEISELEAEVIEAKSKLRVSQAQEEREQQIYHEQLVRPQALIAAKADFQQAKAQFELAKSELERQEGLRQEKIASAKSYSEAKAAAERADAAFTEAKLALQREEELFKNRALLRKDLEIAEAETSRAAQHLDTLKQRLVFLGMDKTTVEHLLTNGKISGEVRVTAPVSGVISHEDVALGEIVHTDHAMFKISDLSSVIVRAEVSESDLSLVHLGDKVIVTVPSYPDEDFDATITYVANHINPETHTLSVSARIPNSSAKFKANMTAYLDLQGPSKKILACPRAALVPDDDRTVVFVATDKGYLRRSIKTGLESKDFVEVLSGLADHDQVVIAGKHALTANPR
jgi:cobalt-zinc-cadmium efflux system membrane fusion protein